MRNSLIRPRTAPTSAASSGVHDALPTLRARPRRVMVDGSDRVTFDDVEVASDGVILSCRVGKRVVWVPPRRMLPGTTIARTGDRGRLVLSREVALNLGLI